MRRYRGPSGAGKSSILRIIFGSYRCEDEPAASLDPVNRAAVIDPIKENKRERTAIVAIVHDGEVREAIADIVIDITQSSAAA